MSNIRTTQARQERDYKDTNELITYLSQRNPFSSDPSLHSITTGVVASEDVNTEKAKEVGEKILTTHSKERPTGDTCIEECSKTQQRQNPRGPSAAVSETHCHCYRRTI